MAILFKRKSLDLWHPDFSFQPAENGKFRPIAKLRQSLLNRGHAQSAPRFIDVNHPLPAASSRQLGGHFAPTTM